MSTHYFLAIRFNKCANQQIYHIQTTIKTTIGKEIYKLWVHPLDYHVTLHFFGELEQIQDIMELVAGIELLPFSLMFSQINGFGKTDMPRVLYLEPDMNITLTALYHFIQLQLETRGYNVNNRVFKPHLTLAKKCQRAWCKSEIDKDITRDAGVKAYLPFLAEAKSLVLYKINPDGAPKYDVIFERFIH